MTFRHNRPNRLSEVAADLLLQTVVTIDVLKKLRAPRSTLTCPECERLAALNDLKDKTPFEMLMAATPGHDHDTSRYVASYDDKDEALAHRFDLTHQRRNDKGTLVHGILEKLVTPDRKVTVVVGRSSPSSWSTPYREPSILSQFIHEDLVPLPVAKNPNKAWRLTARATYKKDNDDE
jgi:hypothetical protein